MSKLWYRYGTMSSAKSLRLLTVEYNYLENGMKALLLTSAIDNRDGVGVISSRIGLSKEAIPVSIDTDILKIYGDSDGADVILVDESQFLTESQVKDLGIIVDHYNIPVICYGLKTDFRGRLFEGSKALLEIADKIEEVKTLCRFCSKKATMNMRVNDGKKVENGDVVQIGGNESYMPVCRKHFNQPPL